MNDLVQERENQKRLESNLSAEFITHDPSVPRGISDGLEYDKQRATFRMGSQSRYGLFNLASTKACNQPRDADLSSNATQLTKKALELYYNSDPTNQPITFSPNVTWNDVYRTAKEARALDNQQGKPWEIAIQKAEASYSSKGRFRKLGRSIGDIAPAIVHKLDFGPDEMYVGVVCQGLKFVFDVSSCCLPLPEC